MIQSLRDNLSLILFLLAWLIVGREVLVETIHKIGKGKFLDEGFLMCVASLGAFLCGEYPEGFAIMLFFRIGEFFEEYAVEKSRKSIKALMDIRPDTARVLAEGADPETESGWQTVHPCTVEPGRIIEVRAGERIPLDGEIISGQTMLDNRSLTGESVPVVAGVGMTALSGGINLKDPIRIRVEKVFEESTVSRILQMTEEASERKAQAESFITRFAHYYTPVVVGLAVALAVIGGLVTRDWHTWIERGLMFLVISCPCALVISIPLGFYAGIGTASANGILVKGAVYLEGLAHVEILATDKTGTLTEGTLETGDRPREEAAAAIVKMRNLGVKKVVMLSGDKEEAASEVAKAVGVDEFHAGLLPADKVRYVEELLTQTSKDRTVAYVGDGINDAPVLARADVGIAMGAAGTDAAMESADVVLMDDRLMHLSTGVRISKTCLRIVKENIIFSIGVKLAIMLFGALGIASMWWAVFADVGVMIIAVLNAVRILKMRFE